MDLDCILPGVYRSSDFPADLADGDDSFQHREHRAFGEHREANCPQI